MNGFNKHLTFILSLFYHDLEICPFIVAGYLAYLAKGSARFGVVLLLWPFDMSDFMVVTYINNRARRLPHLYHDFDCCQSPHAMGP